MKRRSRSWFRNFVKALVPQSARPKLRELYAAYISREPRVYCAACDTWSISFSDFDLNPYHMEGGVIPSIIIPKTICPNCGSHLHHRLLWTILPKAIKALSSDGKRLRVLHFAPEPFSLARLQYCSSIHYLTTDYSRSDVNVVLDMCNIGIASESIDLVIASHVLEHVESDKEALIELLRILAPSGIALLLVPLLAAATTEVKDTLTELDRLRLYGQKDHVRAYGLDLASLLESIGFQVQVISAAEVGLRSTSEYLTQVQGVLFYAIKPAA